MVRHRLAGHQPQRSPTPSAYRAGNEGKPMGQGASSATVSARRSAKRPDGTRPSWPKKTVITTLNRMMIGWANYFCLGPVSKAYRAVERHARKRLRQWLCAKHQLRGQSTRQFSITALHQVLGLVELTTRTSSFPWAKP